MEVILVVLVLFMFLGGGYYGYSSGVSPMFLVIILVVLFLLFGGGYGHYSGRW